jgi:hypothetical protein
MVVIFLILVLFMLLIEFSRPKNTHPTESAWYCHALPLFKILSQDRSGSVLPPTCLDRSVIRHFGTPMH